MLNTIIDYSVFEHLTQNQPPQIPVGTQEENDLWNSLWKYLKQGSNIVLTNYNSQQNIFLNSLTTGRKGTTFKSVATFKKPHKCKFPKDQNIQTVYFLDEQSESERIKYRKNNSLLFGFLDDYPIQWKKLSLFGMHKVLPVRKNTKTKFGSWNQLSGYILPFSDLIIVDNYMFDETIWDSNLFRIIEEFDKKCNTKFNLLLVSFVHSKILGAIGDVEGKINDKLKQMDIACNLSVVLANETIKEHDRGIFTNYLRIKSGDSFVYFDKNDAFITKGTDIDFHTLAEGDKFNASEAALINIKSIIEKLNSLADKDRRLFGNLKNRLLEV